MAEPAQEVVVVIDDDHAMRLSCEKILHKAGLAVETFADGAQGLAGVARLKPGLVLVDLKMPGLSGIEVIGRIHETDPRIAIIVITGYATIDTAVEAMRSGAYDFLPKPFSPDELRLIVNRGLERRRLVLESERCELERALLKRRFVTFVSHQLQSPLVAIHQYLDVLKHLGDTPEMAARRAEWIDRCLQRSEELQTLIKDWLELSRLESDTLARERVRVDVKPIIEEVLRDCEPAAATEDIRLEARLPAAAYPVRGDPSSLTVLFDNLILNAIKYNRSGGSVAVSGELSEGEVVIAVADTGIGIPLQYQRLVFEEFFRVGDGKKTAGTGLGLPIARRIVTELGGTIELESAPGAGSTFRVRLPAYQEQPAEPAVRVRE